MNRYLILRFFMRIVWWFFSRIFKAMCFYREAYMFWQKDGLVVITESRWQKLKYIEDLADSVDLSGLKLDVPEEVHEEQPRNFRPRR